MIPPTPRQLDLLRFIAGYLRAHGGVSPSLAECARAIGNEGKASAHQMLVGLEARGLIRRLHYRHRGIELLVDVSVPTAPDGAPLYRVIHIAARRCGKTAASLARLLMEDAR